MSTNRKIVECRKMPSNKNCDVYMSGSEDHVMETAVAHAVSSQGHADTPELRADIKSMLTDEMVAV